MTSTFKNLKKLVELKESMDNEEKNTFLNKIDMFMLFGRITQDEYQEIVGMINGKYDNGTIK